MRCKNRFIRAMHVPRGKHPGGEVFVAVADRGNLGMLVPVLLCALRRVRGEARALAQYSTITMQPNAQRIP
jgi:hypothetical protein